MYVMGDEQHLGRNDMPITKRQFELGIDDEMAKLMERIYALLSAGPEVAYNSTEILPQVGNPDVGRLEATLEALRMVGAIEKRLVNDAPYYAFLGEVDTKTWQLKPRKIPVGSFRSS